MKDKKIRKAVEQAQQAADQAVQSVKQELDDGPLDQVSGAGNPFDGIPRPDLQPIDQDVRNNG